MKRKKTEYNFDVPVFQESGADKLYNSCYIQDKPTERFSEALKRYMDELGINQKTLELLTGISDTSIYFCLCNQRDRICLNYLYGLDMAFPKKQNGNTINSVGMNRACGKRIRLTG